MAQKKWPRPCRLCKGEFKHACLMCGWKKAKDKPRAMKDLTLLEQAERRGKRNRAQFLHDLDCSMTRSDNHTVNDIPPEEQKDRLYDVWQAENIDKAVEKHRYFAMDLYRRHKIERESIKDIAESTELTVAIVKAIVQLVSDKLVRGQWESGVKSATQPRIIDPDAPLWEGHKDHPKLFNWE